jgi:hypothetical protein
MLRGGLRTVSRVRVASLAFQGSGTVLAVCSCTLKARVVLPRIKARQGFGRSTWKRERDATCCVAVNSCMKQIQFGISLNVYKIKDKSDLLHMNFNKVHFQ